MATPAKRENKRCASGRKRSAATPTRPNARRTCTIGRPQLLGGFAGGFSPKGCVAPAFPQVSEVGTTQRLPKTDQKSGSMAKSAPISCKTAQKSRGCGRGWRSKIISHLPTCALFWRVLRFLVPEGRETRLLADRPCAYRSCRGSCRAPDFPIQPYKRRPARGGSC